MIEVLIGLISGIISGTGMGGGTILILLLSIFMGLDQHVAQATNLVFFVPTAIAAIFISLKKKIIDLRAGVVVIIVGVVGATIGAIISSKMNVNLLKKFFGIFLLIIAIYEIYSWYKMYIKKKIRHTKVKK